LKILQKKIVNFIPSLNIRLRDTLQQKKKFPIPTNVFHASGLVYSQGLISEYLKICL